LFGYGLEVALFRDYESPHDQPIGLNDAVNFGDGCVFYIRETQPHSITVTIDGKPYVFEEHRVTIMDLKRKAGIPLADVLCQKTNELVDLDDNGTIEIHCGDVFISHPRDNSSS